MGKEKSTQAPDDQTIIESIILLQGIYVEEIKTYIHSTMCASMFTAAVFIPVPN